MKKILLSLLFLITLNGFSQSSIQVKDMFTGMNVAANSTIIIPPIANDIVSRKFDLKNIGNNTNTYKVIRYDIILHKLTPYLVYRDSAHAHFCFGNQCYGPSPSISPATVLTASQSTSQLPGTYENLTAELEETSDDNLVGLSVVKYTFFNVNNTSDSLQFTLKYPPPTGITLNDPIFKSVEVFPNPTKGDAALNFVSDKNFESKVTVFNSLGELISQNNVAVTEGKNKIALNTQNLNSGIYFVSLKVGEKNITKKLVVN